MILPQQEPIRDEPEIEVLLLMGNNSEFTQNLLIEYFARIAKYQMLLALLYGKGYIYTN